MAGSQDIDAQFSFLGEENVDSPELERRRSMSKDPLSFQEFASKFFQDKTEAGSRYMREPIKGPLLKQIWGDGDSERVMSVWVSILRFLGDLPPRKDNPLTNIQTVQLICNIAITRPKTCDEIYCQLCKQLTGNPNKASHARGWILMALFCGCFLPSENFSPTLRRFLSQGPPAYRAFVEQRLRRTMLRGNREEPPTTLELKAAFTKKPIAVPVGFYTGSVTVNMDSQTTAAEIASAVWKNPLVTPEAGFSVYVTEKNLEQMTSVGLGSKAIMDVVYIYEQLHANASDDWRNTERAWDVVLRKEVFCPWPESWENIDIIFHQIIDGMQRGHYTCPTPSDLALVLAQVYYIQQGPALQEDSFRAFLRNFRPAGTDQMADSALFQLVRESFETNEYYSRPCPPEDMKSEIVEYARKTWYLEFSKRFFGLNIFANGSMNKLVNVAVNSQGVFVLRDEKNSVRAGGSTTAIASLNFSNMVDIGKFVDTVDGQDPEFTIAMASPSGKEIYTFTCPEAKRLKELQENISNFFTGLCMRSKYVMATLPYKAPASGSSFLSFELADLIKLQKIWSEAENGGWCTGICASTKKQGDFPAANVIVIPSLARPTEAQVNLYKAYCRAIDDDEDEDI